MKKLKLLYAEDEAGTRRDHILYLKSKYDMIIFEASDGLSALDLYLKHNPEIVLTDINMPNMSGLELAKEIRNISIHTKIIILTAYSDRNKLLEASNISIINYLVKPVSRKSLRDAIDIAIATTVKQTNENYIFFTHDAKYNIQTHEYLSNDTGIVLAKLENDLLNLLCEHQNIMISSYDIFQHIWNELDSEYNSVSVRTLVKKLRKKLPPDSIQNIYGGFYRLKTIKGPS